MRQILRMQQGTTLVELLVALALLGVVMAAAGSLYFGGFNLFVEGDNRTEIQDHARMGMDNMTRAIRGAGAMVELQENQVMFLDHSGKKKGFGIGHNTLYLDHYSGPTAARPITSNPVAEMVDEVRFTSPANNLIHITMVTAGDGHSYRLQSRVYKRAAGEMWQ